jgi:hypothetical protein
MRGNNGWHALSTDAKGVGQRPRLSHPCSGRATQENNGAADSRSSPLARGVLKTMASGAAQRPEEFFSSTGAVETFSPSTFSKTYL